MTKFLLKKKLILFDSFKKEYEFFNVEVLSIGYNEIQVLFHSGKINYKGRKSVHRFEGKNAYKDAMKLAFGKINENKYTRDFIDLEDFEKGIQYAKKLKRINDMKSKNKKIDKYKCDICKRPINYKLYEKINKWGRNKEQGNWDYSKESPLYKKVVCMDCQIEQEIFQKTIDENTKLILD